MSPEASDTVTISRAELDALKAELRRLRRIVGRDTAKARILADPGAATERRCSLVSSLPRRGESLSE